ncbi:MAG: DUF3011 domain-containing protein [Rhodanobacteraceae bacterium]|nr:DUF3011 domain-containing protein [Rhodanobacteraceae bacterium]
MRKFVYALAALGLAVGASGSALAQPGRPGWDRDIELRCESRGHAYAQCQVDTGQGGRVVLLRQTSNAQCIEGRTWGWNRAGVWVDRGCSGVFRVERRWTDGPRPGPGPGPGPGGWQPGAGWDKDIVVRCGSGGYRYNMCQVDTGRGSRVYLRRQISDTRCVEGRNWGWNRAGIWVDQGCAGEFVVERRWR